MPINFDRIRVGQQYERPDLAKWWGYNGWQAISRGIITPRDDKKIVLFVTQEKQDSLTQYNDRFIGDSLHMEGETNHVADLRLVNAADKGDEVHLFFRERHHSPFTYHGEVVLTSHTLKTSGPSHFVFDLVTNIKKAEAATLSALLTEEETHGITDDFVGHEEGRKKLVLHVTYERNPKNRAAAIMIHGTKCNCCGFDFNKVYGEELAKAYIEIHHIKSITQTSGVVNPATDLVPLCSNCHSMVHRKTGEIMPVDRLREIMMANGWRPLTSV